MKTFKTTKNRNRLSQLRIPETQKNRVKENYTYDLHIPSISRDYYPEWQEQKKTKTRRA